MLKKITLKNYTTFINETVFDFSATNYKILEDTNVGVDRILKGALFVGENASGKTQVLKAIKLLLDLLFLDKDINFFKYKSLFSKNDKFSLSYEFIIDNTIINYDISFKGVYIFSEKVDVNGKIYIDRTLSGGTTYYEDDKSYTDLSTFVSLVKTEYYNTRFNGHEVLNKWFDFLKNSVYLNCLETFRSLISYNVLNDSRLNLTSYASNYSAEILNNVLAAFNYNTEIVFDKPLKKSIVDDSVTNPRIFLRKKNTNVKMPLHLESSGNKSFMKLVLPLLYAVNNDCMILIDEFSSGLHNEFEETLIKFFFNNSANSQMFFTSHSTNLLNNFILRPDQIYSFKFDSAKGTIIKRFSDETPRESQNLEKMYLNGVFDGNPKYNKQAKI